jgi:hypothetical protein
MSVDSPTRRQPTAPPPPPRRGGFNVLTLIIAAVASVVAAVVVSHFWQSGTLWATAMTPVVVALVKEGLERPAHRLGEATVAPRRRHPDEVVVEEVEPGPVPSARPRPAGYRRYGVQRKHYKLAIVTGLLAFVLGALILTVPELVAGRSITHGGNETTLFKGKSRSAKKKQQPQQQQQTQTVTQTVPQNTTTTPPTQTTTAPQNTTTTPPAQTSTTPPPQGTTPAVPPPASTQPGG